MVSNSEIKSIIYRIIKGSALETEIVSKGGKLYRDAKPTNSLTEDIVISVLTNRNAQYQPAIVNVNIYVPDIRRDNDFIEDGSRIKTLEAKAIELLNEVVGSEYLVKLDVQETYKVLDVNQHCINNRLVITLLNL